MPNKDEIAKSAVKQMEQANPIFDTAEEVENPRSIGAPIQNFQTGKQNDDVEKMPEMGWKKIPLENIPTQGMFYPENTAIQIKAASVAEIRHFSTMDENDFFEVNDTLNMVIEKCCKISMPNKMATFRDLKESDRFYLIFCIREYTFKEGENKLFMDIEDPQTGLIEKIELTKDKFSYYSIDDKIMQYYSPSERCFVFRTKSSGIFPLYVPSIGVTNFIFNLIREKTKKSDYFDKVFAKIAPFYFSEWNKLNPESYKKAEQECKTWDMTKVAVISNLIEKIELGVNLDIKHVTKSGAEVTTPIQFQGGIKSLFLISDIFGELL